MIGAGDVDDIDTARPRPGRRWVVALVVLTCVPLVAAGVAMALHRWAPTGDFALIALRSRDVLTGDTPLTGLVSRHRWSHPGPAMFWLLAPFASIAPSRPEVLAVGWVVLQGVITATAIVLAARVSRTLALVVALTVALAYLALPAELFQAPWNPWMPVPMFALLIVLAARAAAGRPYDLVGIAVVGSVMVQIHAGTAPIVVGVAATAIVFAVIDARAAGRLRALLGVAWWSLGLLVLVWIPSAIAVVLGRPGDLRALASYFLRAPDPPLGPARALRFMAAEFAWVPPWLGGHGTPPIIGATEASALLLVMPVALLVGGWILARRSGRRDDARLVVLAAVMLGFGVLAISRADVPYAYTFEWRGIVAPFVVVAGSVPFVRFAVRRWGVQRPVGAAAFVVVAVVVAVAVPRLGRRDQQVELQPRAALAMRRAIAVEGSVQGRRILVAETVGPMQTEYLRLGTIDALDAAGATVRGPDSAGEYSTARALGPGRVASAAEVDEVWRVVLGDAAIDAAIARPNSRLVWRARPEDERSRAMAFLRRQLAGELVAAGHGALTVELYSTTMAPALRSVAGDDPRYAAVIAYNWSIATDDPCRCALVATVTPRGLRHP